MNSQRAARREAERAAARAAHPTRPPTAVVAATFIRFYGMDAYRHPAYPTRDRVIPFQRFFALLAAIGPVAHAEQYRQFYATALGVSNAMASNDEARDAVNEAVEQLRALAFPEINLRSTR